MKKYITVFTGAGISQESGVPTFRDNNGLWNNMKVEDVASPKGFKNNPQLVWDFYRKRYNDLKDITFNEAHSKVVELEQLAEEYGYEFLVITQNIDGLHQLAGTKNIVELHGDLKKLKCDFCEYMTDDEYEFANVEVPECPCCGHNLRVNVVWFGESLPEKQYWDAVEATENSIIFVVIGTSGLVYPAAGLVGAARDKGAIIYEVNPQLAFKVSRAPYTPGQYRSFCANASTGMSVAMIDIKNELERRAKKCIDF